MKTWTQSSQPYFHLRKMYGKKHTGKVIQVGNDKRVNNDKMHIFGWTTLLHFPFPSSLLFAGDGRGLMIMGSAQLWENTWYEERKSHIDFREREREQQCFFCVLVKQTALGALRGATARLEMGTAVYDTSQTCRMCDRRCWWVEAPDNPV